MQARSTSSSTILIAVAVFIGSVALAPARGQESLVRSTRDGIYSEAQARRGEASFVRECSDCHELSEFIGADALLPEKSGESLWPIFDFMWSEMPEDRPAWLEPSVYADVLAYLLREFGMPAGTADLQPDPDFLQTVRLESEAKDGS